MMLTYFRSVWQGAHPASEVGSRNNSEMEMLAGVIDKLLEGDLAGVGDRLMQRFRCLQMAATHGWRVAQELELVPGQDSSLVPMEMREEALRLHQRNRKFLEGVSKAKSGAS